MNRDDQNILRELQKNAHMTVKAIETLQEKIEDKEFRHEMVRENVLCSKIHNKVVDALNYAKEQPYHKNNIEDFVLTAGIHWNTLWNTSNSKIAEIMIQGSNRGILNIYKTIKHYPNATAQVIEVAEEFIALEEDNIEQLKTYL